MRSQQRCVECFIEHVKRYETLEAVAINFQDIVMTAVAFINVKLKTAFSAVTHLNKYLATPEEKTSPLPFWYK